MKEGRAGVGAGVDGGVGSGVVWLWGLWFVVRGYWGWGKDGDGRGEDVQSRAFLHLW